MNEYEAKVLDYHLRKVYFPTAFKFLQTHRGLRPGCIHTFMGTAGGGKSTLVRSLIIDIMGVSRAKILLVLSEETRKEFLTQFNQTGIQNRPEIDKLHIISELDLDNSVRTHNDFNGFLNFTINEQKPQILIYDNITTSKFYAEKRPNEQTDFCNWLKLLNQQVGMPFLIMAHTGAQVNDNLNRIIDMNDIRGCKAIVNLSHFFYIMQRFHASGNIYPTIRITKHREQDIGNAFYRFDYNRKMKIYHQDVSINFAEFKNIFKDRDTL
jgi:archaellum biogenesis ATPase FlaH